VNETKFVTNYRKSQTTGITEISNVRLHTYRTFSSWW